MAIEEESYRYLCLPMPLSYSTPFPLSKRMPPGLPPPLLIPAYGRSVRSQASDWGGPPFAGAPPRLSLLSPSPKPKKIIRIKDPQTGHDVTEEILSAASIGQGRKSSAPKAPPMLKRIPISCIPRPPPLAALRPRFNYRDNNGEFRRANSSFENDYDDDTSSSSRGRECRIQYDRNFLLKLRNRPASRAKPGDLPDLSHIQEILRRQETGAENHFGRGDHNRLVGKEAVAGND